MNASHTPVSPEWLPFVNVTEEVIPAGAVLEPAGGYDGKGRIRVRKCTADDSFLVFFSGPQCVEAASGGDPDEDKPGGHCRAAWPMAAAAVHPDDEAGYTYPVAAGTRNGDWFLRLGQSGFRFLDHLADGTANVVPVPTGNRVPPPATAGSCGSGSGSAECVVWYTKHMHLGAVAVAVGEVVAPGQVVGYLMWTESGAHLHFTLGDGQPLVWPGLSLPIAGGLVDLEEWLLDDHGITVSGPRSGCSRGGIDAAAFTSGELDYIRERFSPPVKGDGWYGLVTSPFHCDYEYFSIDFTTGSGEAGDNVDVGKPTYNAVVGDDVVTTVESIWRGPDGGFAVLLRHQSACCDPSADGSGSGGDPHDPLHVQFPGRPPVTPPPSGVPRPYEPGSFNPVTRVCLGDLAEGTLIGRASAGAGQWEVLKIGPGLKVENGVLMYDATTAGDPAPEYIPPYVPVTVERTRVTVPAGMLIQETVCSPPATTCCNGPTDPCPEDEWDPILPVTVTGPFDVGPGCADIDMAGEVAWDDAQWRYEGFAVGLALSGDGYTVDVQVRKDGVDWVATFQFVGVGDDIGFDVTVPLSAGPDGTTLVGELDVDRPDPPCSGTITVEVGHPCPDGGWPSTWWHSDGACVEVPFGGTPPEGADGPYDTEAECEDSRVPNVCGDRTTLPRTLPAVVNGDAFDLVYDPMLLDLPGLNFAGAFGNWSLIVGIDGCDATFTLVDAACATTPYTAAAFDAAVIDPTVSLTRADTGSPCGVGTVDYTVLVGE